MPEPKIERYEVITPDSVVGDDYGNIVVTTSTGDEVRVNKKHEHLHELLHEANENGRAVKLGYAVYMNKEYVHTAELFDGKPPVEKQTKPITAGVQKPQVAPQELGMWWKEAGETLRALSPELKQHPMYIELKNAYLRKMFSVLGVEMKHKED